MSLRPPGSGVLALLLALLAMPLPASSEEGPRSHVLIVDSYHRGFTWSESQQAGLQEVLYGGLGKASLDFSVFHLDDRRFPDRRKETEAYFMALYGRAAIDLVITTDNAAWAFMEESPWRLGRGLPLVFAGVNDYHDEGRAATLHMTGVAENFLSGRADTLKAALALVPGAKRVHFILDTTPTSVAIMNEFLAIKPDFPGLDFVFVTEEDLETQVALVARLGSGDIFVPIGTHRDGAGTLVSYEEAMERLSAACPVPSFGFIENRIGHGIVGGKILTGIDHGRSAGRLALAILRGAAPASLPPVMDNPGRFIFDWRQMSRFGLQSDRLPPGSELIGRPTSPLDAAWPYLLVATFVVIVLAVAVLLLVLSRRRIKAAQSRTAASEAILESYFEHSPEAIFVADDGGRFRRVNRSACELTGHRRENLLGLSFPDLLDPGSLKAGIEHVDRVGKEGRAAGEYLFRKADGSGFWMSVHSVRLGPDENLAICDDITRRLEDGERIRSSLAEKETLLRELYHRTKNNMYLIISLLGLREPELRDEADREIFRDMSRRIRTMALIHEKLYSSADLSHVRFDSYIRDLAALLREGYPTPDVAIDFDLEPLGLTVDVALPLGLVIFELLVNSLRHAFGAEPGRVGISLRAGKAEAGGTLVLGVSDDGRGFPKGFDPAKAESMGFQVVVSIVEHQLGGRLSWGEGPGVRCTIVVPLSGAALEAPR